MEQARPVEIQDVLTTNEIITLLTQSTQKNDRSQVIPLITGV